MSRDAKIADPRLFRAAVACCSRCVKPVLLLLRLHPEGCQGSRPTFHNKIPHERSDCGPDWRFCSVSCVSSGLPPGRARGCVLQSYLFCLSVALAVVIVNFGPTGRSGYSRRCIPRRICPRPRSDEPRRISALWVGPVRTRSGKRRRSRGRI